MNKKLLLATVMGLTLAASTAMAAPLDDYSKGKAAVDLGFNWGGSVSVDGTSIDNKPAMNAGVTVGLGNHMALQYKYDNWQSKDLSGVGGSAQIGYQKHQVNMLFQVAPGISPYVGWRHDSANLNMNTDIISGKLAGSENILQVGVLGQYKFANDRAKLWGDIAVGTKNRQSYEIGLGYEVVKNIDLNVAYQYNNIDDVKVKGLTTGVTYKF